MATFLKVSCEMWPNEDFVVLNLVRNVRSDPHLIRFSVMVEMNERDLKKFYNIMLFRASGQSYVLCVDSFSLGQSLALSIRKKPCRNR